MSALAGPTVPASETFLGERLLLFLSNSLCLRASIGLVSASLRPVQQAILSDSLDI